MLRCSSVLQTFQSVPARPSVFVRVQTFSFFNKLSITGTSSFTTGEDVEVLAWLLPIARLLQANGDEISGVSKTNWTSCCLEASRRQLLAASNSSVSSFSENRKQLEFFLHSFLSEQLLTRSTWESSRPHKPGASQFSVTTLYRLQKSVSQFINKTSYISFCKCYKISINISHGMQRTSFPSYLRVVDNCFQDSAPSTGSAEAKAYQKVSVFFVTSCWGSPEHSPTDTHQSNNQTPVSS